MRHMLSYKNGTYHKVSRLYPPKLLEGPVVGCAVLRVGDLDGDDGGCAGAVFVVGVVARRKLAGQRRVRCVGQQRELELDLLAELHGDRVRLLRTS